MFKGSGEETERGNVRWSILASESFCGVEMLSFQWSQKAV